MRSSLYGQLRERRLLLYHDSYDPPLFAVANILFFGVDGDGSKSGLEKMLVFESFQPMSLEASTRFRNYRLAPDMYGLLETLGYVGESQTSIWRWICIVYTI